jgi:hypothetical protein
MSTLVHNITIVSSSSQALTHFQFINTMSGSNFAVGDDLLSCRKEMNFSKPIPYPDAP